MKVYSFFTYLLTY